LETEQLAVRKEISETQQATEDLKNRCIETKAELKMIVTTNTSLADELDLLNRGYDDLPIILQQLVDSFISR
jgi:uncharacterized protein YlxW (UPF0749 family)